MHARPIGECALMLGCLVAAVGLHAAPVGDRGVRFDSPGVLDLAGRSLQAEAAQPVPVVQLPAADDERIFGAAVVGEDPPQLSFAQDEFGCPGAARACMRKAEGARIGAAAATVRRTQRRLAITPAHGARVEFVDWKQPSTANADGDEETHWYLGPLAGSGYLRVEVQFGHDAPGDFLVNPRNGKTGFVHNGADLVAPAPDGKLLLTWNSLNPPLSLRVAALDADGPRLVLQCAAPEGAQRLTPVFKGWHGADAFDLVVEIGEQRKAMVRLALEAARGERGWQLAAGDPGRLERIGLRCNQAAAR